VTTIMHKVLKEQPLAPSELNVQVPRAFDALLQKALAKRPDERFQSAQEFIAAIEAAAAGHTAAADATMANKAGDATLAGSTLTERPPPAATAAATPAPPVPPAKRSSPALAIAAGAAVVVAGAAAWLLLGRGSEPAVPAVAPQAAAPSAVAPAPSFAAEPGTAVITALGLADPADPRYAADKGLLAADLVWVEAESGPYADRNPYNGPGAVFEGVFARIGAEFEGFVVTPATLLPSGDRVVSLGRYTGTNRATGEALDAQFVHVFTVTDGKITHMQQYTDTAQWVDVVTPD